MRKSTDSLAGKILQFYASLNLQDRDLPDKTSVMNPYRQQDEEVKRVIERFYYKYYDDHQPRGLILGINPGRFGAGVTGIPFTDTPALRDHCGLEFGIETRETSAEFVYKVVDAMGGPELFYKRWFIGAVCPLGFVHQNQRGNWVNYNYYDDKALFSAVENFIVEKLRAQISLCGNPGSCVVLGNGKNYKALQKLNQQHQLFEEIIPLEHPRYVMQYKKRYLEDYIWKFTEVLG